MAAPIGLRLDQEMRACIERIARHRKIPASHILREAVTKWIEHEEEGVSPYESIKDLIGVANGNGLTDLSRNSYWSRASGGAGDQAGSVVILVDAGPSIAFINADDQFHGACSAALKAIRQPLSTVGPVVTEARKYADRGLDLANAAPIRVGECEGIHQFVTVDQKDSLSTGFMARSDRFWYHCKNSAALFTRRKPPAPPDMRP